jgi:ABC-2 type transport system permease protein
MSDVGLALRQIRFENRSFWRNPAAAFFTFVFPLMFLAIFNLLFGNEELDVPGGTVSTSTFYVPAIAALSVISACYTNIAIGTAFAREQGVLKRVRGTPLPPWAYLVGRVGNAMGVAVLLVVIISAAGVLFYDVDLPTNTAPAFIVTVLVGALAFSSLGLAISGVIPNADAAPPVTNATILPLLFISDVFLPIDEAPSWLVAIGNFFPIRHFSEAMQTAYNPFENGAGFEWDRLAIIAAWGVAGLVLAARYFKWESRK